MAEQVERSGDCFLNIVGADLTHGNIVGDDLTHRARLKIDLRVVSPLPSWMGPRFSESSASGTS